MDAAVVLPVRTMAGDVTVSSNANLGVIDHSKTKKYVSKYHFVGKSMGII